MRQVICAVETAWPGMRQCSLTLAGHGASVLVLIKGAVEPEVLAMITRPANMAIRDVPARAFTWRLAQRLLATNGAAGEHLLIVNRPKTLAWTSTIGRLRGWRVLRLQETGPDYHLFDADGREVPMPSLTGGPA